MSEERVVEWDTFESVCKERNYLRDRCAALQDDLNKAKDEIARLVALCDKFKQELQRANELKNRMIQCNIDNMEELRADYEARGRVIKKLRKRLHKLKKKLKH